METLETPPSVPQVANKQLEPTAPFDPETAPQTPLNPNLVPTVDLRAAESLAQPETAEPLGRIQRIKQALGSLATRREKNSTEDTLRPAQDLREAPEAMLEPEKKAGRIRRVARFIGKIAGPRIGTELIGLGVDAALIGGGAVIGELQNVAAREVIASGVDVAALNKLSPHEKQERPVAHARAKKVLGFVASGGAAVVAQKVGPGVLEHVSAHFSHGVPEYAAMLSSKVGATTGVNNLAKRVL